MAKIEEFASAEVEAEQDGGFAAWLKSRGADNPEIAEWADEDAEDAGTLAEGADDRPGARSEG